MPRLIWDHTEFGRRDRTERFRIVHTAAGWTLLDAAWTAIASYQTVQHAQAAAERLQEQDDRRSAHR